MQQEFQKVDEMKRMNSAIADTVNDIDKYMEENKDFIEKYLDFINSEEYKNTPAYKIKQMLLKFQQESGYYDIFIENLKILSPAYKEYIEKLQAANKVFLDKYPEAGNIYNV